MSTFSELDNRFFPRGETYSRDEIAQLVSAAAAGNAGPVTSLAFNPGAHVKGRYFTFTADGTYTNFLNSSGTAIVIDTPPAGKIITNGQLYDTGVYYIATYTLSTAVDTSSFLNKNTDVNKTPGSQLFDKATMTFLTGFVLNTTGNTASQAGGIIVRIPINPAFGGGKITIVGVVGLGVTGAKGYRFMTSAGVFITGAGGNLSASVSGRTLTMPGTAAFLDMTVKIGADADAAPLDAIMVNYGPDPISYQAFVSFVTGISGNQVAASFVSDLAKIVSSGTEDASIMNRSSTISLIKTQKKPTNLSFIDRWLDGYKLIQISGAATIYTTDDGLQNASASTTVLLVDALTNGFIYDGKALSVLVTRSSFFYNFRTPRVLNDINFANKTTLNVEIKSLATLQVIARLWRVTGGGTTVTEIITEQTLQFTAGAFTKIQFKDFDLLGGHTAAEVPSFHLRFHTLSGSNYTAAIIIGRITISNIATDDLEFDNDEPRIVLKKYNPTVSAGSTAKPVIDAWGDSMTDEVTLPEDPVSHIKQVPYAVPMRLLMPDRTIVTHGYAGYTASQIRDKFLANLTADPSNANATKIFWPGRNDLDLVGWPYIVFDCIKTMVNALPHSRFVVANPASGESSTGLEYRATISNAEGARYKDILLYQELCRSAFGNKFLDLRKKLVEDYDFGGVRLLTPFAQPASGASVQISVSDTTYLASKNTMRIGFFPSVPTIGGFADYYDIVSIDSPTLMTIALKDEVGIAKRIAPGQLVQNPVEAHADGFTAMNYLKLVTASDYQDHSRDITATSGRVDTGHVTTKVNATVVAPAFRGIIESLGF